MPDEPPPPRRRRALAVVLGVLAALALGEVVARVVRPAYAPRTADYEILPVSDEPPSWVYAPGSTVTFTWDGDPIGVLPEGARQQVAINGLGLRGPLPGPGERAVVVLGDSFTFGEGVADGETFVGRLDAAWRERGVRFVNAGVAGHGTVEEAARIEGLLDRLRPVAVVLVHVPNDAIPWQESAARGSDLLNVAPPTGSRLLAMIRSLATAGDVEDWYLSWYVGADAAAWRRSEEALGWMATTCAARGARFGVVAFPLMHRLDDYPLTEIRDLVRGAAVASGAPFLDLLPAFAQEDAAELWAHPADRHPNSRAHAIAAEALARWLRDDVPGLLPPR